MWWLQIYVFNRPVLIAQEKGDKVYFNKRDVWVFRQIPLFLPDEGTCINWSMADGVETPRGAGCRQEAVLYTKHSFAVENKS